ncbi:Emopamil-binding protein [Hyaloscypha variabilis]
MSSAPTGSILDHLDTTTLISLSAVLLILLTSYNLSLFTLSSSTPTRLRILFIWHFFDFLIHTIFEGSFLYNCFFVSVPFNPANPYSDLFNNFLGTGRLYGSAFAGEDNVGSKLWMVYAKADRRWAGADLTVVSLELLTVLGAGPLALYICSGIAKKNPMVGFWMIVLATGELYGGFMTFCPEWLTGNPNLDASNFMFKWVYLVFFNMLWVVLPLFALHVAFVDIKNAMVMRKGMIAARVEMKKREAEKEKAVSAKKESRKGK